MKKQFTVLCLFVGVLILLIGTSTDTPDIIYWDKDYKLTWDDFEGTPRFDYESISALTSSGIVHYKGCKDGKIIYKIQAYFEKHESWVKDEARTDHHLEHEQLHFDITELYTRKLRKALTQRVFMCGEEADFEIFTESLVEGWQSEQQAFDLLTRHSMDREAQQEWVAKIHAELAELEAYKISPKE